MEQGARVFVNAMNGLGDFLLTMPTLREMKRQRDARVTVLLWYYLEDIGRALPFIDRFIVWNEEYRGEEGFRRLCDIVAESGPYDLSIDLAYPPRSAILSEASGAPVRLQIMSSEELRPGIERIERRKHNGIMTETYAILDRLGVPRPERPEPARLLFRGEDFATAREILRDFTPGRRRVLIHPGAGVQARRWTPEKFAALADALAERYDAEVMFLGGRTNQMSINAKARSESEEDEVGSILALARRKHLSAAGRDNTRVMALLLEQSDLFIGCNSGPAHLSGQLGCRTLVLWGPSDPQEWSPVGPEIALAMEVKGLECYPCSPKGCEEPVCMWNLEVDHALVAIERRWPGLAPRERRTMASLEVASGERPQAGYIHLDRRPIAGVEIVGDVAIPPVRPGTFRQLHAQHIIEHFPREAVGGVLRRWVELLQPGGSILVVTPNIGYIADGYMRGTISTGEAVTRLYGEQNYPGNFHFHLFDRGSLMDLMREAGCDPVYDVTARNEKRAIPMSLYVVGFRAR